MASNFTRSSIRSDRQIPPLGSAGKSSGNTEFRSKAAPAKRASSANSRASYNDDSPVPGRVRVAVRLRPRNAEDLASDADFADCVELQPEMKRLKLKKNNWNYESFKFDEIFTETASQKRVYEVVAKPVVESVLKGYNGTVMAYGQTGTGKTYTLGQLGKDDPAKRGMMVRALEDILADTSPQTDTVAISYLQLYLESIQDLLVPEKNNVPILEDPKTGEVFLPGAAIVKVRDIDHFLQLLQTGEANRHVANTKLNAESSRSHAILTVYIQRSVEGKGEDGFSSLENNSKPDFLGGYGIPVVLKSKLLIVDLAGSERIDKSGSEGHKLEEAKFVNLSLTSLGKCINALAENSLHVPTRDSKLTRLLRDSFGGSSRTSLVITIGPSSRHHGETASTIMFGQRAMKVENMVKLREEIDYESLCRKLDHEIDCLTAEVERHQKLRENEKEQMEKKFMECQDSLIKAENSLAVSSALMEKEKDHLEVEIRNVLADLHLEKDRNNLMCEEVASLHTSLEQSRQLQVENSTYQKVLADTTQMYEQKVSELIKQLEDEHSRSESAQAQLEAAKKLLNDQKKSNQIHEQMEVTELRMKLKEMYQLQDSVKKEIQSLQAENADLISGKAKLNEELQSLGEKLVDEKNQRKILEDEFEKLKKLVSRTNCDHETRKSYNEDELGRVASALENSLTFFKSDQSKGVISNQRATIAKLFKEVGLQKVLALLRSKDLDVQIHAAKVVANLAAEDVNQERIVQEGGLDALLMLLESSLNTTIHRVASGAIANLAMSEVNQGLIMSKGGARLLANVASKTDDPQTLRMVAGAIANLCGNESLHLMLKEENGIKALLGMVTSGHNDVIAQVARGIANFAKCESRGIDKGHRKGQSLLIDDGALTWMVDNCTAALGSTRRHIELALCHLAQNEANSKDFVSSGAIKELIHISKMSSREDIRNLAGKALATSPTFLAYMQSAFP